MHHGNRPLAEPTTGVACPNLREQREFPEIPWCITPVSSHVALMERLILYLWESLGEEG